MELPDDPRSREALADPVGFFHRLRAHDPVHWRARAPDMGQFSSYSSQLNGMRLVRSLPKRIIQSNFSKS
jgi:hypothetical protein